MRIAELRPVSAAAWAIACVLLFVFGMSIPKISTISAAGLIGICFGAGFFSHLNLRFFWRLFLLVIFSALYFTVMVVNGFVPFGDSLKFTLVFSGLYASGYVLACANTWATSQRTAWMLASLAAGFVAYGFGSVVVSGFPLQGFFLPGRALSIWGEGGIHKTVIGVFSSFGMCFLVAAFATKREEPQRWRWIGCCVALAVAGFAGNLAVQNRTPLLAMLAATSVGAWIVMRYHLKEGVSYGRFLVRFCVLIILAFFAGAAIAYYLPLLLDTVFLRFRVVGVFETARFDVWRTMFEHLFDFPFGGRAVPLSENYAHNVWLDSVYDVGLPISILLLVFHLSHVRALVDCVSSLGSLRLRVTIAALGTSLGASFLVEPVMAASAYVFAASCFILGVVLRLSHEIRGVETFSDAAFRPRNRVGSNLA